jgi:hypothetical protein
VAETQGTFFGDCPHAHKVVVPEKRGPHHAKLICKHCKKFFGWIPKPETVQQRQENDKILTALSKMPNLGSWEREFVRNISETTHLSPKQQKLLLELWEMKKGKEKADDSLHGETLSPNRDPSNNV